MNFAERKRGFSREGAPAVAHISPYHCRSAYHPEGQRSAMREGINHKSNPKTVINRLRYTNGGTRKLSLRELSKQTGIPRSTLHQIERGELQPPDWMLQLATAVKSEWRLVRPREES